MRIVTNVVTRTRKLSFVTVLNYARILFMIPEHTCILYFRVVIPPKIRPTNTKCYSHG